MKKAPKEFLEMKEKIQAAAEKSNAAGIKMASVKYEKLPPEITASIAKRAKVQRKPIDELSREDRQKLRDEAKELINVMTAAFIYLTESVK